MSMREMNATDSEDSELKVLTVEEIGDRVERRNRSLGAFQEKVTAFTAVLKGKGGESVTKEEKEQIYKAYQELNQKVKWLGQIDYFTLDFSTQKDLSLEDIERTMSNMYEEVPEARHALTELIKGGSKWHEQFSKKEMVGKSGGKPFLRSNEATFKERIGGTISIDDLKGAATSAEALGTRGTELLAAAKAAQTAAATATAGGAAAAPRAPATTDATPLKALLLPRTKK
jgi:hypothetical protein